MDQYSYRLLNVGLRQNGAAGKPEQGSQWQNGIVASLKPALSFAAGVSVVVILTFMRSDPFDNSRRISELRDMPKGIKGLHKYGLGAVQYLPTVLINSKST